METFLERVCAAFNSAGLKYALAGGHAVALHGAVRGTVIVDFVLEWNRENLLLAEQCLGGLGLVSQLPITAETVFANRDEYIAERNLIAWPFYHAHNLYEQVDLLINYDLLAEHSDSIDLPAASVMLLNKPALIAMKRDAGRAQDIADIQALEKL